MRYHDGAGMPAALDLAQPRGLQLVGTLVELFRATFVLAQQAGAHVQLVIPVPPEEDAHALGYAPRRGDHSYRRG
jgi:two-component sensor histidine kinase